jgi:hypothetical protein
MKKLVFSIIFVNFIAIDYNSFLFSSVINQDSINPNKAKIKVAALFSKESLTLALKKYEKYEIYLENKSKFIRFFIVNIPKDNLHKLLKNVRKDFSDAFIYKKRLSRNSKCLTSRIVNKNRINSENNQKKQINFLNSDTILQTRKKFY